MKREYKFKESKLIKPVNKSNKTAYMIIIVLFLFIVSMYIISNNDIPIHENEALKEVKAHSFRGTITNSSGIYYINSSDNNNSTNLP